jgi:hypothetical protein
MSEALTMSNKERERLKVLERVRQLELGDAEAAVALGISLRQFYRIKKRFTADGDTGLVHRARGRASNNRTDAAELTRALALHAERYSDYGPTLLAEMLLEHHQMTISPETLRQWLIGAGRWEASKKRRRHRKKRARRQGIGELVQIDGSFHDWFEGRAPVCCLLVAIDDASSRVLMRFAESENTRDVLLLMHSYVSRYGIPGAVYTDGGTVYYSDSGSLTDFARACEQLNIQRIRAHSPQAKGRVERSNRTQQDRLIKAMRQAGISSIAAANSFLDEIYHAVHNTRFAQMEGLADVHRSAEGIVLDRIFCFRCERAVANDYTVRHDSRYLQLLASEAAMPPPRSRVELQLWLDDSLHIQWKGEDLAYQPFEKKPPAVTLVRPQPAAHPWKRRGTMGDKSKNRTSAREKTRQRLQKSNQQKPASR